MCPYWIGLYQWAINQPIIHLISSGWQLQDGWDARFGLILSTHHTTIYIRQTESDVV